MNKLIVILVAILATTNLFGQKTQKNIKKEQRHITQERYGTGQYKEDDGINYQNYPYTTFNRNTSLSFQDQLEVIRKAIKQGYNQDAAKRNDFSSIYSDIYNKVMNPIPWGSSNDANGNDYKDGLEDIGLAAWAKNAAFVYLIGLTADTMQISSNDLDGIGWNAEYVLQNICPEVSEDQKDLINDSRRLIAMVQAYDLLKAGNRLQDDRNHDDLTVRDNIRLFARNLYRKTKGQWSVVRSLTGHKKNHGISTSSALGLAAFR